MSTRKRPETVTIADVARKAGVSTATAGRVLGEYGYSSSEIREKVRASAEALGYRPNLLARGLITGKTRTIGVIAGDIQSPFYSSIVRGIADIARNHGFGVIITNSDETLEREVESVKLLLEKQVDGLIVAPADLANAEHLRQAVESGCPIVQIDRIVGGLPADSVTIDNRGAAKACVSHMLATGHRRIAMLAELFRSDFGDVATFVRAVRDATVDERALLPSWQRLYGYVEAHLEHGVALDVELVSRVGIYSGAAATRATRQLMDLAQRPTAIFTADGLMSAAAMEAITRLGLRVPGDISVACFDDLDWMQFLIPGFTAVAQPLTELGEVAASLMLARLEGEDDPAPQHRILAATLNIRGSVVPPA
jgi:LacI family transcriptional regulator